MFSDLVEIKLKINKNINIWKDPDALMFEN